MNGWIRNTRGARHLFAALLLCALAVRIVVPIGFMPTQSHDGIVISLCTGQGMVTTVLPVDREDGTTGHHAPESGECAFAAGLSGGLTLVAPILLAAMLPMAAPRQLDRRIADLTVHRLAAPPPPAQGPPARA